MANRRWTLDWIESDVESHCNPCRHALSDRFPPFPTCPLCGGDGWEMPVRGQTLDHASKCRRCGGVGHLTRRLRRFTPKQLERITHLYEIRRMRREGCGDERDGSEHQHDREIPPPPF